MLEWILSFSKPWRNWSIGRYTDGNDVTPLFQCLLGWLVEQIRIPPGRYLVRAALALLVFVPMFLLSSSPQLEASAHLEQVSVKSLSHVPGARTTYVVSFVTAEGLDGVSDSIDMELHQGMGVPARIRATDVTVTHSNGGSPVHGHLDQVSLSGQNDPERTTTVSITPSVKVNGSTSGIPAGATVTVTFTEAAGFSNPPRGGAYSWLVRTSGEPEPVAAVHPDAQVRRDFREIQGHDEDEGLLVERTVTLSKKKTVRGEQVAVTAKGYREGLTLWVWRDSDTDGQQDDGESQLCEATVGSSGIGGCSFEVRVPPFTPASADCRSGVRGCNLVNAADGAHRGLNLSGKGSAYILDSAQLLELVGKIETSAAPGSKRELQVKLTDFPPGTVESVTIGGEPTGLGTLEIGASGRLSFRAPVPAGVRAGQHLLAMDLLRNDTGQLYSSSLIVEVAEKRTEVGISPETVVPNQTVAIWGKGFSTGEGAVIREVRVGGHPLQPRSVNYGDGFIPVDPDGSWAGTLNLPVTGVTTEPGVYSVELVDSDGQSGSVEYTVGPREVTVSPVRSRAGAIVEISGSGFPARSPASSRVDLLIHYESPTGRTTTTADADHEGNFTQQIRVPLDTPSPSSNELRVEFEADDGEVIATMAAHEVSEPEIEISPTSGPPGAAVTLTGIGFRHYAPVTSVAVGGMDVLGGRRLSTDANGRFSLQFIAPGAGFGPQPVRVDVSGTLARAYFQVSPGGSVTGNGLPVAEALAGMVDRLDVVFYFDNLTKGWSFYDPLLGEENTLRFMSDGGLYFILVSETVEAVLNGRSRTLTCRDGNCWNVIVW